MRESFRKSLSLGAGIAVSLIVFYILFALIYIPFALYESNVPLNDDGFLNRFFVFLWVAYIFVLPPCVFLGGFVSGLIYQPAVRLTIKHALCWGPGIYVALTQLIDLLPMPHGLPQIVGSALAFFLPSWLGMKIGISKRLRQTVGLGAAF